MLQRSFQKISIRCKSRSFVPHWLSRLSMNFIDIKLNSAWIGQICRHNQLFENASNVVTIEGKNSSIIMLFQVKTGYREILIQLYDHWVLVNTTKDEPIVSGWCFSQKSKWRYRLEPWRNFENETKAHQLPGFRLLTLYLILEFEISFHVKPFKEQSW